MLDDNECGAVGGMIGSTLRKHAPVPLRPPKIPLDLALTRTRASEVGSRRLTPTLQHGLNLHSIYIYIYISDVIFNVVT
jgi:hypothetical protein